MNKEIDMNVRSVEPIEMFGGMQDCIAYACKRFEIESTSELTDKQWAHATAEYIASLTVNIKDFREFTRHFRRN